MAKPLKLVEATTAGDGEIHEFGDTELIDSAHIPPSSHLADHLADHPNPHRVDRVQIGAAAQTDMTVAQQSIQNLQQFQATHEAEIQSLQSDWQAGLARLTVDEADLASHKTATNPHHITAALIGAVTQAVYDIHANNAAIHTPLDDHSTGPDKTWSAQKIEQRIQTDINNLIGAAPGTLDTIHELATAFQQSSDLLQTVTQQLAAKANQTALDADIANLTAHVGNSANPHSVTATQLGIPAGSNQQVQVNNAGVLGACPDVLYDPGINQLTVPALRITKPPSFVGNLGITLTAANTDNLNHANLATANVVVITPTVADSTITGVSTGFPGRVLAIVNGSSTLPLHFRQEVATSTAPNRFSFDITIRPNMGCLIFYNSVAQRWGPLSEVGVFGRNYRYAEVIPVSTTTSTAWQDKVSLTVPDMAQGLYRIQVGYGWNYDDDGSNFQSRILLDDVQFGELHYQEPTNVSGTFGTTGTDQRHYISRSFRHTFSPGQHVFKLQYSAQKAGEPCSMWDASLEVWRVQ